MVRAPVYVKHEQEDEMGYSEEFRAAMVRRMSGPGAPSATALSQEVGVSQATLSRWLLVYGGVQGMGRNKKKSGRELTAEEKLKVVLETSSLGEAELGEYLRREGLHSAEVERWRAEATEVLKSEKRGRPKVDPEVQQLRKERKLLKRELQKKDRALAEASALLVMKKKAELIWGASEDDESE